MLDVRISLLVKSFENSPNRPTTSATYCPLTPYDMSSVYTVLRGSLASRFFSLFICGFGGPCHFSFREPVVSPIDPAQKPQNPEVWFSVNGAPAIFRFGNRKPPPRGFRPKAPEPMVVLSVVDEPGVGLGWRGAVGGGV